jgi:trimethylamine--corrinoid protein Co-methyltransferase
MERAVCSADKPAATQPLHNLEALFNATTKHIIIGAGCRENVEPMIDMAKLAAGGQAIFKKRPIISFSVCSSSPLTLSKPTCEIIMASAQAGIGLWLISMVLAGGTGPITLAGSIVQHNAEILGALILAQLTKKGIPCTYCSSSSIMYMKNASSILGAPEYGLMGRATAQMARFYSLPSAIATGVSDSKITDVQAAYETAINLTQVALSRPHIVYGLGSIEGGLTFDLAKLVLDCEHARHLLMVIEGIPVDEYQLAFDEIQAVGPGGNYLLQQRTRENMKSQSAVNVFDRTPREIWQDMGSPRALESAYQKAIHIIETHQPKPLPQGVERALSNIVNDFEIEHYQKAG